MLYTLLDCLQILNVNLDYVELACRSNSVMDCHATAWGSIPGGNGVFTELHIIHKEQ